MSKLIGFERLLCFQATKLYLYHTFIELDTKGYYSCVPKKRAGSNERAGSNKRAGSYKRAGWKIGQN